MAARAGLAAWVGGRARTALGFSDKERIDAIMAGIEGKKFTYRRSGKAAHG